jgi:nitrite reductase/ring-hydroxylating ferredoxin subunit
LCATHGAAYLPTTGACVGGPCRGGLVKIALTESGGVVRWHTDYLLQAVPG